MEDTVRKIRNERQKIMRRVTGIAGLLNVNSSFSL